MNGELLVSLEDI